MATVLRAKWSARLESREVCAQRHAMLRAKPTLWCALGASLGAACVNPEAETDAEAAPLIGRLQMREGTTDLTVRSFADGPNAVPTNSYARVIADIAPTVRRDDDRTTDDASFTRKREFLVQGTR